MNIELRLQSIYYICINRISRLKKYKHKVTLFLYYLSLLFSRHVSLCVPLFLLLLSYIQNIYPRIM